MVDDKLGLIFNLTPVPKGRPRFTRQGHAYTDARTREYEKKICELAKLQYVEPAPLKGPLKVSAAFYFTPPKSDPDRVWHTVRPDVDNLLKACLDGLEKAGVFENDSQIVEKAGYKGYSETPYITVEIQLLE